MSKNKEFIKQSDGINSIALKDALSVLLIPMSIILVGVLVSVSVLYSANVILQRDQLVTKSNLAAVVTDALNKANLTQNTTAPTTAPAITVNEDQINSVVSNQPIVLGDKNSKLKFVEFSDPSCPFCSLAAGNPDLMGGYPNYKPSLPEIQKLVQSGKASFTWIYLPTHGLGEVGAHVYYCANEKGKFWEVHDKLLLGEGYKKVNDIVKNDFSQVNILADYVKEFVDPAFMISCVQSKKYSNQLNKDISVATSFGADSTPSFFVGTDRIPDSDFTSFATAISKYK